MQRPFNYSIPVCVVLSLFLVNGMFNVAFSWHNDTLPSNGMHEEDFYQRIEIMAEDHAGEEDIDFIELIEELEYFVQNPLNLNYAREEDLQSFFFLNDFQIRNLLNHIAVYGRLLTIFELQAIEGWDLETIELIRPYVMVAEERPRRHFSFDDLMREGRSQMFIRYQQVLQEQKGYSEIDPEELAENPNARYLGSPYRLYSRYRFTYYNNISLGFTAQKHPGEEFFRGSQPYGFEFYSGHLFMRDFGRLRSLAIGDFQAQFGQGLALWSNLSFGKSFDAINIKKNPLGLRQYTSADRNNFMRGAGSTFRFGDFEITGFFSYKKRDANVLEYDTLSQEALAVTGLTEAGYARLPRELENKRSVDETVYGGNVTYKRPNFSFGATAYYYQLGAELKREHYVYNQFDFSGQSNTNISVYYNYIFRNFNIFGEAAYSESGGYAILKGFMASIDPRFSVALLHRYITKDYHSLMGNAFTENTRVINEQGIYLGLTSRLSREWTIYAYADHFSFPWMKWRTYAPSNGYDYLVQINFRPSRQVEMYLRYRNRNKPLNTADESMIKYPDDAIRQNVRFNIGYDVSRSFTFRNRVEFSDFKHGNNHQQGYMLYHDIIYRTLDKPWAVTLRYALFETGGHDSRVYVYENNVLYAFGFPFYSDKGSRAYLLIRYGVTRNIDIWARYAQTFYTNRNTVGTGLEQIDGNMRSEITAQVRLRF